MANPTAEEFKTQGNAAYALGDLTLALQLFESASALDPTSPVFLSNASATLYEMGRYDEALQVTSKAINLDTSAPALAAKLALRRVKILLQLRRFEEAVELSTGGEGEMAGLREIAVRLAAIPALSKDEASTLVLDLPVYKAAHPSVTMEYFAIGHDDGFSALSAPPDLEMSKSHEKRFKLDIAGVHPISCVIGGSGDGRHAIATVFDVVHQMRLKGTKKPLQQPHVMLSLVGEWMDRTRQTPKHERRGPDETLPYIDLAQYEVYGRMKILFPSRFTLAREPKELREPLEKVMKSRKVEEQDVSVCSQYVRENWKANPVFLDPTTGDTVEYFKDPCGNFHNIIKSWNYPISHQHSFDRLHDYTDHTFNIVSATLRAHPRAIKFELVVGDVLRVLECMQLGVEIGRPATFPIRWDHVYLSNIPDYVGGLVLPITQMGLLKPLESSFVAFNCLLNTRIYPGALDGRMAIAVNSTSLTSLGVTLQQLPATFGAQFVNVVPIAQLQEYALYSPLRSTRLSKIDIKNYIHATFLRLALPSRNSSTKNVHTVREPLNLSSLFRILRRLHEAGYPAHHLTDALAPLFSNTLVTRARPPPDHIPLASPIPLSTAAPISTAPFLPELVIAASVYHHSLPFPILTNSILPLSEIGRYNLQFHQYQFHRPPLQSSPALALLFTKDPSSVDHQNEKGDTSVQSRVLRGGRSADTVILHSSLTATHSGPDSEDWDVTFAMPVETVAKLWREGWSVTLWDLSTSFSATEEVLCTERTVVCVGTLADGLGRRGH